MACPPSDFHDVLASIERWEDWCRAWSARAKVHEDLGHEALARKAFRQRRRAFRRAAVIYHFAKYLFVNDMSADARRPPAGGGVPRPSRCPISIRPASG